MIGQKQRQKTGQIRVRGQGHSRAMSKSQIAALGQLQEEAFVLAPRQLKSLVEMLDIDSEDNWEGLKPDATEFLDDPDSELESLDDDELLDELPHQLEALRDLVSLARSVEALASPVLDPGDVYALHCSLGRCRYEAPPWMLRTQKTAFGKAIGKSMGFLHMLCDWLESRKSGFLENPSAASFVFDETVFDLPIVTQDGLREVVIQCLPGRSGMDKSVFSRLSGKIWLFWPDRAMPLRSLFSTEFRVAWVTRGCLFDKDYEEIKRIYLAVEGMDVALNQKRQELERVSFANLDPLERLIVLCGKVKISTEDGLAAVIRELEGVT